MEGKSIKSNSNWLFWLLVITAVAIIIRSLPAWMNAAWGVDFGIYFGLAKDIAATGVVFPEYNGWGSSYNYFPVLYLITVGVHWVTGLDIFWVMPKLAPFFGGLTVFIFYFVVYELVKDKRVSLFSSAFLAVSVLHVYQTSHAAPLTVGHFFMMLSLYFFIRFQKKPVFSVPLVVSTFLLILSHHFTTYFYILTITFLTFAYVSKRERVTRQVLYIIGYVFFVSTVAFSYWMLVATPVYQSFMRNKFFSLPANMVMVLFYVFLFVGVLFAGRLKRFNFLKNTGFVFPRLDKYKKIVVSFLVLLCILIIASVTGVPGVYVKITPMAIVFSVPMLVIISFSYAGFSSLNSIRNGFLIKGWIIGILLSLLYSLVSAELLPDRHLEYLVVPSCIPAALTLKEIIKDHHVKETEIRKYSGSSQGDNSVLFKLRYKRNILATCVILVLFIANLMSTYPTIDSLKTIDERVSTPCVNVVEWMKGNISNSSVIASDHRLEMLAWAEGFNITYCETNTTWTAENFSECRDEIIQLNISYVVIDDIMRDNVVNVDVGKYYYMTNESYDKFKQPPFELVYRNATVNSIGEEIHWVEIYAVNWSSLDQYIKGSRKSDLG